MTTTDKLAMVKAILRIDAGDTSEDALITTYLAMAEQEIIGWRYSNANPENVPDGVPAMYEMTQVQAVINGYTQSGVEGQVLSIENGIHRHFEYADMVSYIRSHVIPIAGVMRTPAATASAENASSAPDTTDSPQGEGSEEGGGNDSPTQPDNQETGEDGPGDGEGT